MQTALSGSGDGGGGGGVSRPSGIAAVPVLGEGSDGYTVLRFEEIAFAFLPTAVRGRRGPRIEADWTEKLPSRPDVVYLVTPWGEVYRTRFTRIRVLQALLPEYFAGVHHGVVVNVTGVRRLEKRGAATWLGFEVAGRLVWVAASRSRERALRPLFALSTDLTERTTERRKDRTDRDDGEEEPEREG